MRILLDARTVGRKLSGVGNYVLELVRALSSLDVEHTFVLIVHGDSRLRDLSLDGRFELLDAPCSQESHPWGDLWEELVLPRLTRRREVDVLHGPAFLIPARSIGTVKVVTIPDLVAFTHPQTIPRKYALYMRWLIERAVRKAHRVIAISRSVKRDLQRTLGVPSGRIDWIHLGLAEQFRPSSPEEIARVRAKYRLSRPYLLFVGNLEPRKNLPGLLSAFRQVRDRFDEPIDLVVAGKVGWLSGSLLRELAADDLQENVKAPGFVSPDDLPALYGGAEIFVFPTFWEGFGLPVLEAMACRTPVVASGLSSIPEVAGDAAVVVDPHSPASIAEGILKVLRDPERRDELVRRGAERAGTFTWQGTARSTLRCYERALEGESG